MKLWQLFLIWLIVTLVYVFAGCAPISHDVENKALAQAAHPEQSPTPATINGAIDDATGADKALGASENLAVALTPDTVLQNKPELVKDLGVARIGLGNAIVKMKAARTSSITDLKEKGAAVEAYRKLKERDPILDWIKLAAFGCIALGIAVFAAGLFLPSIIPAVLAGHTKALGLYLLACGVAFAVLASIFDDLIECLKYGAYLAAGAGFIWLAFYAWRNRRLAFNSIASLELGKMAGEVTISPTAAIVKTVQTKDTQAFVNAVQKKLRKHEAKPKAVPSAG